MNRENEQSVEECDVVYYDQPQAWVPAAIMECQHAIDNNCPLLTSQFTTLVGGVCADMQAKRRIEHNAKNN